MTSRQNQPTMAVTFEPGGMPGTSHGDLPARTPHEIIETLRPGTGRVVCAVDSTACAGHHHRSGEAHTASDIHPQPAEEETRRRALTMNPARAVRHQRPALGPHTRRYTRKPTAP